MKEYYDLYKTLHIIFVVSWFAGLFYIVRLFIYHTETQDMEDPRKTILAKQYKVMEERLWYIIAWPAMILTTIFGGLMVYCKPEFLTVLHFQLKLGFVIILYIYHLSCGAILKQLKRDEIRYSSTKLRIWNEVATILLVAIVCLIVLGYKLNFLYGMIGFVLVGIMLMVGIKLYKRIRKRKEERQNGKSDITKMMEDHSKPEEQSTTISDDDKTT